MLKHESGNSKNRSSWINSSKDKGFISKILSKGTLNLSLARKVTDRFQFSFSKSLLTGYSGFARLS
jgi:hypothetical protein